MKVRIKKLSPDAVVPKYANNSDAGLDLVVISKEVTDKYIEYGTGLAIEIPDGYVGLLFPRSSVSKKDLQQCNSVGVIDSGYRGEIKIRFNYFGDEHYEVGEKAGQLIIIPYPKIELEEVESLEESDRGEGSFGSTGN